MASRTTRNIWRSKRLIIRPAEPKDETFLQSLYAETSHNYQNVAPFLPVPQGAASARIYREFLEKSLIGCIIYISPPAATETEPATTAPDAPPKESNLIPIGTICLTAVDAGLVHHRNTSIGVNIAPPYQAQGYGSEVILWALEWAFRHANMHRVEIGAFAYNEGAWKLYERLGFTHEGRKREALYYDGDYRDLVELGMLRREWQNKYGEAKHDG